MNTEVISAAVALLAVLAALNGLHKVPEGHVGLYYRGGALLSGQTGPGFHIKSPLLTSFVAVQTSIQTDKVLDIPCGTSGGVMITFDKIEVVNRLPASKAWDIVKQYTVEYDKTWIYDKIHHEVNQFCSAKTVQEVYIDQFDTLDESLKLALQADIDKWSPGIEIIAIRVTKPRIPEVLRRNYEQMEAEKSRLLITTETQRIVEKEAETERKRAVIEAEKRAEVQRIAMDQQVKEKESMKQMAAIEDDMHLAKEKALADAAHYKLLREAEANKLLHTPEFLQLEATKAVAKDAKLFFGNKLPEIFMSQPGELLAQQRGAPAAAAVAAGDDDAV